MKIWFALLVIKLNVIINVKVESAELVIFGDSQQQCGRRSKVLEPSDVCPCYAQIAEYPWYAAILKREEGTRNYKLHCSGAIIDKRYIVTTATCIDDINRVDLKIILGSDDISNPKLSSIFEVKAAYIHDDYAKRSLKNNIGLLETAWPINITLSNSINTICLPEPHQDYTGSMEIAYFRDREEKQVFTKGYLNSDQSQECKKNHGRFFKENQMLCIKGEGEHCNSYGAPLVQYGTGKYSLVGIYSHGLPCRTSAENHIFTNIANYVLWLKAYFRE